MFLFLIVIPAVIAWIFHVSFWLIAGGIFIALIVFGVITNIMENK